jgi:hypothetical protein
MAWAEVSLSTNTWNEVDNKLYVVENYWIDGYTIDTGNIWAEQSITSNTWTDIG